MATKVYNLGKVVGEDGQDGKSATDLYNELNGTSLTDAEFIALLQKDPTIFQSMDEAEAWLTNVSCEGGQLVKVLEDGEYVIYIVQPSDESDSGYVLEEASMGTATVAIDITSFTNNISLAELGSTVTSITFTWAINQTPYTLTLGSTTMDTEATSYTMTTSITATTTYTLTATTKKGGSDSATTTVRFCNGIYYGVSTVPSSFNNDFILSLTKKLVASKSGTYSVTSGEGEYVYFALPVSYGTPTITIGGFEYTYDLVATLDFTNASGYTESYNVYQSGQKNLGTLSITLS